MSEILGKAKMHAQLPRSLPSWPRRHSIENMQGTYIHLLGVVAFILRADM